MSTDLGRLRADLTEHAEHVVVMLLGEPKLTHRSHSELRYGSKGSLAIVVSGGKAGIWYDHESGEGGDLLALIKREHRCDFCKAVKIAETILQRTYSEARKPKPKRKPERTDDERCRYALSFFREAQPLIRTLGEEYLVEGRRIDLRALPNLDEVLRFHPRCPFDDERHSALIALFRNIITNAATGIYRIRIDPMTLDKIKGLSLGPTLGAVIKLYPDDAVTQGLCIAEGVETALSAATIVHHGTVLAPIWATGGASGLAKFPVLDGIEALTIVTDHDAINERTGKRPGIEAALECAKRWHAAGREVERVMSPREGEDLNDIIKRRA
jgi:putative DNA primase/helicase